MKNMKLLILLCLPNILIGCPYTFINDTKLPIILSEKITKAYYVPAGDKTIIEAPMTDEHDSDMEKGHGNGHAAIYVYMHNGAEYHLTYKIKERACGKDSVIKASELPAMMNDQEKAGRFEVSMNDADRKDKKHAQLAEKITKKLDNATETVAQVA
jgi:hypothetical protein